jgi:hypothetical protein
MGLDKIGWEGVNWIHLAKNGNNWLAVLNV